MTSSRQIRFVVASDKLSGEELIGLFGEPDEPVLSQGDTYEVLGRRHQAQESTWIVGSSLPDDAAFASHLKAVYSRLQARFEPVVDLEAQPIHSILQISHYMDSGEFQGHGFVIGSEWISLLARTHGIVDIDQYVTRGAE